MDASAVNAIRDLAQQAQGTIVEIDGRAYSTTQLHDPRKKEEAPATLTVATLSGLVGYVIENRDALDLSKCLIHIAGPARVDLLGPITGEFNQRFVYVRATLEDRLQGFQFGSYMLREDFQVALQARFKDDADRALVLKLIGNIVVGSEVQSKDDGITQRVEQRAGVSLVDMADLKNPVTLTPFRTFHEVDQPSSPFILRVKPGPMPALFDADGGAWKIGAIENIRDYLASDEDLVATGIKVIG